MYDLENCPRALAGADAGGKLNLARHSSFIAPKLQASSSWHSTKARGDYAELRLADYFVSLGYTVSKTISRADHDLTISKRLEVKADGAALRTGNAAIEVSYDGKPSGIHRTSANLWAIIVGGEAFIIETSVLRELVESGNYRTVAAGDGGRSRCVLVPVGELRRLPGVVVLRLDGHEKENESAPSCAVAG